MLIHFDFDAAVQAPFRMQPGLRRMAVSATHFTPIHAGSRHQREKLAVLSSTPERALVASADFDPTVCLNAVFELAQQEHPEHFAWDGRRASAPTLGVTVDDQGVHRTARGVFGLGDEVARCIETLPTAWQRVALLALTFAEDLAIVDARTTTVPWIAATLPSRWSPQAKVGRTFAQLHADVADNANLLKAGEHLMQLVCSGERWERFVWNVTGHSRLNAHPLVVASQAWATGAFDSREAPSAWFRSERQTFVPLAARQQAVFMIGVDCEALPQAIDSSARAATLRAAVDSMSDQVLAYRGLADVKSALIHWLDRRATT